MNQRITVKHLAAENIPDRTDEDGNTLRIASYDRTIADRVVEEVFEGDLLPVIHYTDRSSMVEIKDLSGRTGRFIFGVFDVLVERLDEGELQSQVVDLSR